MTSLWLTLMFVIMGQFSSAQTYSLDHYLSEAYANSPLLRDFQNQVLINKIDSERLRATFRPQVNGTTNNSYAPVVRGYGYDDAITNGANISAVVGVNKNFIGQHHLQSQFQILSLAGQQARNSSQLSRQELKKTVTAQYISAYGDLQQLNFGEETVSLLNREDTILRKLAEDNVYRQTDYLTFLVTLQQQRIAVAQSRIQYENDLDLLNYLCGVADTQTVALSKPDINMERMPGGEQSVFFQKYLLDSLRLRNERAILDYSYKPRLNVFADAGYISSLVTLPYRNVGFSFGFGITVPIYDGHQKNLQYRRLDIAENTRGYYKKFFSRQYNQEISRLSKQFQSTQELIREIDKQISYAEGLVDANSKLLLTGDVRIADLVIALNNYLAAKNSLNQNMVNSLQIINELNYWSR